METLLARWEIHKQLMHAIPRQWIKGSLVNFICEAKSVSKQDALILITWSSKVMQWTETTLSKLAIFPCIHWVEKYILSNIKMNMALNVLYRLVHSCTNLHVHRLVSKLYSCSDSISWKVQIPWNIYEYFFDSRNFGRWVVPISFLVPANEVSGR